MCIFHFSFAAGGVILCLQTGKSLIGGWKTMIQFENVTKTYARGKVKAVDGLDMKIEEGKVFGFIGPNGAGKTTTIKLLNAYDRMGDQGIEGTNLSKSMQSIEDMLDTAIEAFKKQLDSLFANQALDIETDISVMNQMLAREGLSDESTDTIIKAARSGKTE